MKHMRKLSATLKEFTGTIRRFPISILFFLISAILTAYKINTGYNENYFEMLFSFLMGAAIFMVLQMIYERFINERRTRLIFGGLAVLGALIYYLVLEFMARELSTEIAIRTLVLLFILFVAFIWIPSIKSKIGFSDSFMAVFKGSFTVAFYSGVMFLGIALILMAIDMLIVNIDNRAYSHTLNIIAFIYVPLHFLSLIPIYPVSFSSMSEDTVDGNGIELEQRLRKAIEPSKFLEGLISFIIIPITAVFTIILLLYIVLNITGDFWKDNLMESLLVTYSITVITVYLLASVIKSKSAIYFRKIFPKVLIPVVLFQTISSILKIGELGITGGRYYVILFGVFATISAIIFSLRPNHKTNLIAPILIILSLISILPPTDAFMISKKNQISRLTNVLKDNKMLQDDKVIPNPGITQEDKQIIINSVRYLNQMNYTKEIGWLKTYSQSYDFESTFGFPQYGSTWKDPVVYQLYLPKGMPMDVSGYDYFVEVEFYGQEQQTSFEVSLDEDKRYILSHDNNSGIGELLLRDSWENELIRYPLSDIYDSFKERDEKIGEISPDEAKFIIENNNAILCIVTQSVNYEVWDNSSYQYIDAYIMIKIK